MRDLSREKLLAELLALRPELEREGVRHLGLFGSRARGDNRQDSDIDLIVDLSPDESLSLLDIIGIGHKVEDRLGLPTHIVLRRSAPERFLTRTAQDEVPVF